MNLEVFQLQNCKVIRAFTLPLYFYLMRTQERFLKTDHYFPVLVLRTILNCPKIVIVGKLC